MKRGVGRMASSTTLHMDVTAALLLAALITLLIEKPGAWALGKLFKKLDKRGKQA